MNEFNLSYNSLKEQLIKDGILSKNRQMSEIDDNSDVEKNNIFSNSSSVPLIKEDVKEKSIEQTDETEFENSAKKRLNQYDCELIQADKTKSTNPNFNRKDTKTAPVFSCFEQTSKRSLPLKERFLLRFCPKIYKSILIKRAINKFRLLNITSSTLKDKNIPYGEQEERYEDLIKYINCANEIRVRFKN